MPYGANLREKKRRGKFGHTVLYPIGDTYVYNYYPDDNYGAASVLSLYWGDSSDHQEILLNFNLSSLVGTIKKATLKLKRQRSLIATDLQSGIKYIKSAWDASTVTYNTLPTIDSNIYDYHLNVDGEYENWDVTEIIQNVMSGIITDFNGFYIFAEDGVYADDLFYPSSVPYGKPILEIAI